MRFVAWVFCMLAAAVSLPAAAQGDYPTRPVKIIVPYAPGGATDIIARIVAQRLGETLGQSFVVDNRPGASGNLALEVAGKAPADGYTLLVGNVTTNAINENTFEKQLQIKPTRDLTGIAKLVEIPHIVVATASFPAKDLAGLIAIAKKDPGKINYASAGIGSYPHLDMEMFQRVAAVKMTHIPYKGGAGQMLPALLSGEAPVAFINLSSALPQVRAGKLKALATTAKQRLAELPGVATMAEQGYSTVGTNAWQGMFAPAATPKPIIDKLHRAVMAALTKPDQKESLAKQMMTVEVSKSPQDFDDLVRRETRGWGDFLREADIRIE